MSAVVQVIYFIKINIKKFAFYLNFLKFKIMLNINYEGYFIKVNINFHNEEKERKDYELFSLKITDSLYKKDIGKFLETISSHFI